MTTLFTPKQIRCEHCGFEFMMTEFGSAAKIVCLACGQETTLSSTSAPPSPDATGYTAEFPGILSRPSTEALLCSVEQCPLLTNSEEGSTIADQVRYRLRKKAERRRNILAWTVTLQVCVLIGVLLFVAKPFLIPDKSPATNLIANIAIEPDAVPTDATPLHPIYVSPPPLPAVPEAMAAVSHTPKHAPFVPSDTTEHADVSVDVFPLATANQVFPPPIFDAAIGAEIGTAFPSPPLAENPETLSPLLPPTDPISIEMAESLLKSAKATLATAPESSVQQSVRAAKIYEELGQVLPDSLYWIIGNACASLSWGEPLLESSPAIETITLSANNRFLLAQLRDRTVWLWDLQSPEGERGAYPLDKGTAEYVKFVFSPDLHWIIGGQKGGTIRIWDMRREDPAEMVPITFVEEVPDLKDLQISPNGQWLAAFGNVPRPDRSNNASDSPSYPVLLWNLRQMESGVVPMATLLPAAPQSTQIIQFSPNSDRLAVGSKDAIVRVYDLNTRGVGEEHFILRGHKLGITQIVFAPCGQWVATGSQDNTVRLWNLTASRLSPESTTLSGHIGWISALTIDKTGEYIISGSYDRTIRIWNIRRNRITLNAQPIVLKTNLGVPESLALTQDGDKMVVLGSEGSLGIYHLASLLADDPENDYRAVTFRNSEFSISRSLLTTDDQLLIFSYEHLSNPLNNGIRLWALQAQPFVQ